MTALSWAAEAECSRYVEDWGEEAVESWFFPDNHAGPDPYLAAREICADCPVSTPCLEEAIATNTYYGMRGGLTPQERSELTGLSWRNVVELTKRCPTCGIEYDLTDFGRNRSRPRGIHGECRRCHTRRVAAWKRTGRAVAL